jgi:hypothetical protein
MVVKIVKSEAAKLPQNRREGSITGTEMPLYIPHRVRSNHPLEPAMATD